jgi:hypothetical protein
MIMKKVENYMKKLNILKFVFPSILFVGTNVFPSEVPNLNTPTKENPFLYRVDPYKGTEHNSLSIRPETTSKKIKTKEQEIVLPPEKIETCFAISNREKLYLYTSMLTKADLPFISFQFEAGEKNLTQLSFENFHIHNDWFSTLWPTLKKLTISDYGQKDIRDKTPIRQKPPFKIENALANCTSLQELNILRTKIAGIVFPPGLNNLKLNLTGSHLLNSLEFSDSLGQLALMNCSSEFSVLKIPQSVHTLTLENCPDLELLEIEKENQLQELTISHCEKLTINLDLFPNLKKLHVTNSELIINIENCSPAIQDLSLINVKIDIKNLNFTHLPNLQEIVLWNEWNFANHSKAETITFSPDLKINSLQICNFQLLNKIINLPLCSNTSSIQYCPLLEIQNPENLIAEPQKPFHDSTHNITIFYTCTAIENQYKKIGTRKTFKNVAFTATTLLLGGLIFYNRQKIAAQVKQLYTNLSVPRS